MDPLPSWVMLAIDKENGLHGVLYVEFLPRIMQRVAFCSCESNGGFSTKFTMIHSSIYMSSVDTLVYGELPSSHDLVVHGRAPYVFCSWMR